MTWEDVERKYRISSPAPFIDLPDVEPLPGYEWTCDTISGIDDAFVADACTFCDKTFDCFDSLERGRHLVDVHHFGQCDHDDSYAEDDLDLFRDHVLEFHQCGDHISWDEIRLRFRRIEEPLRASRLRSREFPETQTKGAAVRQEEPPQTRLILQARLDQVIHHADVQRDSAFVEFVGRGHFAQALRCLDQRDISLSEQGESRTLPCFEAACLEEEMVISGFDDLVVHRRPPDYGPLVAHLEAKGLTQEALEELPREGLFSIAWVCRLPNSASASNSLGTSEFYSCADCARNYLYDTRNDVVEHIRTFHPLWCPEEATENDINHWAEEIPLKLNPSWITRRSACRSGKDMIHHWLRAFLIESPTLRTLLRTSKLAGCTPGTLLDAWAVETLESWDMDITEDVVDEVEELLSDGAVDSRDNLRSLLASSLPASADGRRGQSGAGNTRMDLLRKRLPDISDFIPSKRIRFGSPPALL